MSRGQAPPSPSPAEGWARDSRARMSLSKTKENTAGLSRTHSHTCTHTRTNTHTLTRTHTHACTHGHTRIHTNTYTCKSHTHFSTLTVSQTHTHKHILAQLAHTLTFRHSCTCTQCSRSHVLTLAHTRTRTLMRRCFEGGTSGRICWPRGVRRGRGFAHLRPRVWTRGRLRCCQRLRGRGGAWESAALSERASSLVSPLFSRELRFRYPLRMRRARPTPTAGVLPT